MPYTGGPQEPERGLLGGKQVGEQHCKTEQTYLCCKAFSLGFSIFYNDLVFEPGLFPGISVPTYIVEQMGTLSCSRRPEADTPDLTSGT
jgi:hypothetical protein